MTAPASTRTRDPRQPVFVPLPPVPWDDLFLSPGQRWLMTFKEVMRSPGPFFGRVALDQPDGAGWIPLVGALGTALVHGLIGTLLAVSSGSTISAPLVLLELTLGMAFLVALGMAFLGGMSFALGSSFGARRIRSRSVLRLIAFASTPMLLGLLPIIGPLLGLAGVVRALVVALRVRGGLTRLEAGACLAVTLGILGLFPIVLLA
ncbi:MAG: YIP1 family protein [Myxococcota bacterium]